MKWLFLGGIFILSACGEQAVRPESPSVSSDSSHVFIAWDASQVTDIREAFDFDRQYCQGTIRQAVSPVRSVQMSIRLLRINHHDVSQRGGIWLKPGRYQLHYQISRPGKKPVLHQGRLQAELKAGASYFIQAAYYDYKTVKLEKCQGHYFRLKDDTGITDYPVCDGRVTVLDQ